MVSEGFRDNLNEDSRALLSWNSALTCYHGDVGNVELNKWLNAAQS